MTENAIVETKSKALITGASSGIGAAFARRLADDGFDLILIARREELLVKLCKELEDTKGINAEYMLINLEKENELAIVEERIKNTPNLEILINNAGFGGGNGAFYKIPIEDHINMVKVHTIAPIKLAHAVIPNMLKNGKGVIINVSSIGSFSPSPGVMYSTTKISLNYLSESLDLLLRKKGIKIQALCPGFTITDFHKKMGYESGHPVYRRKFMTAEKVVEISLKALKKGKVYCIPGFRNKLLAFFMRKLPKRILIFAYRMMFSKRKKRK
ncbi:MAG: SDR family NAD(P)-dependent oxidoreductase [Candidatus Heimdallarchaeota archaeon]|nr:SDR family NAD(P)-dependent oxidoreductase [Candidatus Heimdallarchaeota archaeon]MBY8993849.1 SDR family NAD(P)-dependent oxidoreductase [Candidatus Heimdallarchaeota archaeon]